MGVIPGYLPLRFGRGQKYPPVGICGGAHSHLELQIYLKKIASLSIIDGFERSILLWIGNDVFNFSKIAAILNFHVNMPPTWIFVCFWNFFNKIIFPLRVITAQSMLYKFLCRVLCGRKHILNEIAQFTDYITFVAYKTCFLAKVCNAIPHLFLLIMNRFLQSLCRFMGLDDAESIFETLEVPRSGYNRLPVTINIGHQTQCHYYGSDEPSHIVSLSMMFWAR